MKAGYQTVETYRGVLIAIKSVPHPDGCPQIVYHIPGMIGQWNSRQGARDYIDWVLAHKSKS